MIKICFTIQALYHYKTIHELHVPIKYLELENECTYNTRCISIGELNTDDAI